MPIGSGAGGAALEPRVSQLQRLRRAAKRIPPLYWLAGFINYAHFRRALARANGTEKSAGSGASPPPLLRYRVHRAFDEASYVENGRLIARCLVDAMREIGVSLKSMAVLDFACGPGRVIKEFARMTESCTFYGSDIDEEAIAWAQSHLSEIAQFSINAIQPPTDFPDAAFDVIYSVSLFTHLDEHDQDEWLDELSRILKPDGVLVATTHGRFAKDSCTAEELKQLQRHGIFYRTDRKGRFKVDGLPDFYQTTFHTLDYVKQHWGSRFTILNHLEGGLGGHQDLVIMRKSAD